MNKLGLISVLFIVTIVTAPVVTDHLMLTLRAWGVI